MTRKGEETCSSFVNSPFHVPTPGYSASSPCITTSNTSSQPNSHRLQAWGGDWLSPRTHLPSCFYYHSHLSLPPVAHLSSHGSRDASLHNRVFTVNGWRYSFSSYQRLCMYSQWLQWGYWCASRGHDLGGTTESLWKGMGMGGSSYHLKLVILSCLLLTGQSSVNWLLSEVNKLTNYIRLKCLVETSVSTIVVYGQNFQGGDSSGCQKKSDFTKVLEKVTLLLPLSMTSVISLMVSLWSHLLVSNLMKHDVYFINDGLS